MPELPHSALAARNRQARQVGGDYYDALPFGSSGKYLLTVVDISGKGIGASLLMASIQATLRALLSVETTLVEVAAKTSDLLYRTTPPSKYATAIMVLYDPYTGECEFVNGGHNEGVVLRANGEIELLRATGVPMGLLPARTYDSTPFTLESGDILLIYSDGAVDACTEANDEFELDRLTATLTSARNDSPEAILDHTLAAIDEFVAGAPQFDDITMMVLKRQA
jgi:sigma-B regulation protein RsbU (phosphoserine phosphatase)